ncbi:(Fe-S)-binding protein [Desulfogranum mediterraneum]|uniref:(Fe-S)-binding protein n=1 Tax=Desulfogranum mediterraneum TaxID=160661 RepID=UPI0006855E8C|nr:(Fe-S)-binding protein [Desulfogranum mediterraneum]
MNRESYASAASAARSGQILDHCTDCGRCLQECGFLRRYGSPLQLAGRFMEQLGTARLAYQCSLCGLCTAVCPLELDPCGMLLEQRVMVSARGQGRWFRHLPLRWYEGCGSSALFSWYGLPEGCTTVFFPGCSLAGSLPERVVDIFQQLGSRIPSLGLVLDCCHKLSHDLGEEQAARAHCHQMLAELAARGVERLLVNCPSCLGLLSAEDAGLSIGTVYEEFAADPGWPEQRCHQGLVTVHDPCSVRTAVPLQRSVRTLLARLGLQIEEMEHHGATTLCCGEGGGVGLINRELALEWAQRRHQEAAGRRIVTYCAGCTSFLSPLGPVSHLIELLFAPAPVLEGEVSRQGPSRTYLNRLALKRRLKLLFEDGVQGRRGPGGRLCWSRSR